MCGLGAWTQGRVLGNRKSGRDRNEGVGRHLLCNCYIPGRLIIPFTYITVFNFNYRRSAVLDPLNSGWNWIPHRVKGYQCSQGIWGAELNCFLDFFGVEGSQSITKPVTERRATVFPAGPLREVGSWWLIQHWRAFAAYLQGSPETWNARRLTWKLLLL